MSMFGPKVAVLALCIGCVAIASAQASDLPRIRVSITVSSPDEIKGEVTSYLSRELRKLGDIDVVENDPSFSIGVIALALKSKGNLKTGYAFGVLVTSPAYPAIRNFTAPKLDAGTLKILDQMGQRTVNIQDHFVQSGATDQMDELCHSIVASIDGDVFEPERKVQQQIRDYLSKATPTPSP